MRVRSISIAAGGLALALALGGAATMATAEEITPPTDTTTQEATPSTDTTTPASPTTEEAAPVVSDPTPSDQPTEPTTEQAPAVEQTAAVVDTGEQITLHWLTPNTGDVAPTAENVGWPQSAVDPAQCGTGWLQNDVNRYGTPADKASVDAQDDDGLLTQGEDYGTVVSWTFTRQTPCVIVTPPVEPIACVAIPGWATEDIAPDVTDAGLVFAGPHAAAVDYYQRVSAGNLQGLTGMSYTIAAGATGNPAQLVVEVNPNAVLNAGGPVVHYATLSTNVNAGTSGVIDAQNLSGVQGWSSTKIATGPGSLSQPLTFAEITALMPANTLLSAPSLHQLTNSSDADRSVVTAITSSCGAASFVTVVTPPVDNPPTDEPPVVTPPVVVPIDQVASITPRTDAKVLGFTGEHQSASDGRNMAMAYALLGLALGLLLLSIERLAHYSRKV